jgi:hypothetical protein
LQISLTTLDSISLFKSPLDEKEFSWLKHFAAVEELEPVMNLSRNMLDFGYG